jgi:hypothetical protein
MLRNDMRDAHVKGVLVRDSPGHAKGLLRERCCYLS